jgi:hypothetical protein
MHDEIIGRDTGDLYIEKAQRAMPAHDKRALICRHKEPRIIRCYVARNVARTCSTNVSAFSIAAKWPPLAASPK